MGGRPGTWHGVFGIEPHRLVETSERGDTHDRSLGRSEKPGDAVVWFS